jgi:hypothetical protein
MVTAPPLYSSVPDSNLDPLVRPSKCSESSPTHGFEPRPTPSTSFLFSLHIHPVVSLGDTDENALKFTQEQMLEEYQFTASLLLWDAQNGINFPLLITAV